MAQGRAAAHRALTLDSASASAYLALGSMEMFWHWNLPRAGQLIDRGVALEPSDPEAHAVRGTWFRWRGEMDSAVAEARKSVELDPLGRRWPDRLARQLILARRYAEAEAVYRRMMRDDPRAWPSYMGLSDLYKTMGRMRDAIAMWRAADSVSGDSSDAAHLPIAPSEAEAGRWFADQARTWLDTVKRDAPAGEWVGPTAFAYAYASLRDTTETLHWFDSMLVHRDPALQAIPLDPEFDFLRDDPRYRAWEAKLPWGPRTPAGEHSGRRAGSRSAGAPDPASYPRSGAPAPRAPSATHRLDRSSRTFMVPLPRAETARTGAAPPPPAAGRRVLRPARSSATAAPAAVPAPGRS